MLVCIMLNGSRTAQTLPQIPVRGTCGVSRGAAPIGEVLYGDWNGDGAIKSVSSPMATGILTTRERAHGLVAEHPEIPTKDACITFGQAGDTPLVGDWTGDGRTKIGIFRNGNWYLDYPGTGAWAGCGTTATTDAVL